MSNYVVLYHNIINYIYLEENGLISDRHNQISDISDQRHISDISDQNGLMSDISDISDEFSLQSAAFGCNKMGPQVILPDR